MGILGALGAAKTAAETVITLKDSLEVLDSIQKRFGNPPPEQKTKVQLYYEDITEEFCGKEDSREVEYHLISKEALNQPNTYLEAFSCENPDKRILDEMDEWCKRSYYGVMLLHGEPGHGKTTLCRKAVYDFCMGNLFKSVKNVFWFRLNPAYSEIITDRTLLLEKCFCWGKHRTQRQEIPKGSWYDSLFFLDGYDELKQQAAETNVHTFSDFFREVSDFAKAYHAHIVITARTRSLEKDEIKRLQNVRRFAPLTYDQQKAWIHARIEFQDYETTFERIREDENMQELLGIPILFRMIVNCRFADRANNMVDLYDKLFRATMLRQSKSEEEIKNNHSRFEQLAFDMYQHNDNDTDISNTDKREYDTDFMYLFYLKGERMQTEFIHRSFYQYFLANFFYHELTGVTDEASAEHFLCRLAERCIDNDILRYMRQVYEMKNDIHVSEACQMVIDTIERTDAIVPGALETSQDGNGTKTRFDRCENVFYNAVNVCNFLEYVLKKGETPRVCSLLSQYNCDGIWLAESDLIGADLSGAYLSGANFIGADLIGTCLIGAHLIGADLSRANLSGANFIGADLRGANLSGANFIGAKLSGADLRFANNLDSVDLNRVETLEDCKILLRDKDTLKLDDPDAYGIIWCDDNGNPIKES